MFMVVSYPWPVPSAHVPLTGAGRKARRSRSPQEQQEQQDQPATKPDQQRRILVSSKA